MKDKSNTSIRNPNDPILFVDDDPIAHMILKTYLSNWDIESVASAEKALEVLKKKHFSIVITDIQMPGMDGITLVQEIRKLRGIVQVIILTASSEIDDLVAAFEAGVTDFLLKPLDKHDIEEALENVLAKLNRWKTRMKLLFEKRREPSPEELIPLDDE